MTAGAGPGLRLRKALALIAATIDRQAALLSYSDVFRELALVTFACVPIVFFLKKVKGKKGAPTAH